MEMILAVLFKTFNIVIEVITIMMLIRAVVSWFPAIDTNNQFMRFIYTVTETLIAPVRKVLWKIDFVRSCPLDLSFLATYLLLHMAQSFVAYLYYAL